MKNPSLKIAAILLPSLLCLTIARAQIVISGFMANPTSTDSPHEYVQLMATQTIDFSLTNYCVVWADNGNGSATANGWVEGGNVTYGFNLTSGIVYAGDIFYVGGSARLIDGAGSTDISAATWIRFIDTLTASGDGFGNPKSGVLGNGGNHADGIAIFSGLTSSLTDASIPLDAVFFGSALGTAVIAGGTDGYILPANDLYSGGFLGSPGNTALMPDPAGGDYIRLTGTYDFTTNTWIVPRTGSIVAQPTDLSDIASQITLVPEPASLLLLSLGLLGLALRRRLGKI